MSDDAEKLKDYMKAAGLYGPLQAAAEVAGVELVAYTKRAGLYAALAAAAGLPVDKLDVSDVHQPNAEGDKIPATIGKDDEPDADADDVTKALGDYTARVVAQDVTFAKGDASLYVSRPLTAASAERLHDWAVEQGIKNIVPPELMHVTQVHSSTPVTGLTPLATLLDVGSNRWLAQLGKERCLVMHFSSPEMNARFKEASAAGATWDFDYYRPHITLSYDAGSVNDYMMVEAPDFPLQLGPEEFKANNSNWVADNRLAVTKNGEPVHSFETTVLVKQMKPDRQIIGGWASIASINGVEVVDKQGDIIPVEELEKAFHEYVLYSRDHGVMHDERGTGRLIACLTFTPEKAPLGIFAKNEKGESIMGTWVEYLITSAEVWKSIRAGHYPEFSIGGRATPVQM